MDILKKFLSRKFLAATAGIAVGAGMAFGGLDGEIIVSCAGAAMACISAGAYIVTEGRIDAAAVKQAVGAVQDAVEAIADSDSAGSVLDQPGQKKLGE